MNGPNVRTRAPSPRLTLALATFVLPVVMIGIATDAAVRRARRAREEPVIEAYARRLPSNDLALSGGARWLRFLSMEEPGAAFADGIALPDPDPAGGAVAPPRAVWGEAARRTYAVRRTATGAASAPDAPGSHADPSEPAPP